MNTMKFLRIQNHMSQIELAEKLKSSQSSISQWEAGKTLPDAQTLIAYAKMFDVSLEFLTGMTRSTFSLNKILSRANKEDPNDTMLISKYREADPKVKYCVNLLLNIPQEEQTKVEDENNI